MKCDYCDMLGTEQEVAQHIARAHTDGNGRVKNVVVHQQPTIETRKQQLILVVASLNLEEQKHNSLVTRIQKATRDTQLDRIQRQIDATATP